MFNNNFNVNNLFNKKIPSQNQMGVGKYKTTLCKHYNTSKGCVYKDKCQFAHGEHELRMSMGGNNFTNSINQGALGMSSMSSITNNNMNYTSQKIDDNSQSQKKVPNPANFKIVKCKNFDKDGQCKYGSTCTFAHGDQELRTKVENTMLSQTSLGMNPYMYQPYMMDPNLMMYMAQMNPNFGMTGDMSQMQMFAMGGNLDPSAINLNSNSINPNPNNGLSFNVNEFANPGMGNMPNMGSSMGFYPLYGAGNGQNPNN